MSFNLERILESKRALRRRLATLPVAEKLRMLDAMRERAVALQRSAPTMDRESAVESPPENQRQGADR